MGLRQHLVCQKLIQSTRSSQSNVLCTLDERLWLYVNFLVLMKNTFELTFRLERLITQCYLFSMRPNNRSKSFRRCQAAVANAAEDFLTPRRRFCGDSCYAAAKYFLLLINLAQWVSLHWPAGSNTIYYDWTVDSTDDHRPRNPPSLSYYPHRIFVYSRRAPWALAACCLSFLVQIAPVAPAGCMPYSSRWRRSVQVVHNSWNTSVCLRPSYGRWWVRVRWHSYYYYLVLNWQRSCSRSMKRKTALGDVSSV